MYLDIERDTHRRGEGQLDDERPAPEAALAGLDLVYAFIYSRVGNPADAEDLTQQVALKAMHRLRSEASNASIRAYLFATARSVLAAFWSRRYRMPEAELAEDVADDGRGEALTPAPDAAAWLELTLSSIPAHYRQVLELRFLQAYSLREVAAHMGKSVGAVKLMQMRALRTAALVMEPAAATSPSRFRQARHPLSDAQGSAFGPRRADPTF